MTREQDIALLRRGYELWREGDLDGLFDLCDDEIEWIPPAHALEPAAKHGKDAMRAGIASYFEVFEEFWPEPEEILDTDDPGVYLVMAKTHTKGRGSGASVTIEVAHVVTIREGRLVRFQVFVERAEALAALGLERES